MSPATRLGVASAIFFEVPQTIRLPSGILHTRLARRTGRGSFKTRPGGSMTITTQAAALPTVEGKNFRWLQLAMGIACMAMIANLQYGSPLFVHPIDAKFHWGRPPLSFAF